MGNEEHKYDTFACPSPFNHMMLATGTVHNNHWVGLCVGCCNAYIPYIVNCGSVCAHAHANAHACLWTTSVWYPNKQSKLYVKDVI